jgi:tellurite resistance protein TehA-like permease
MVLFGMFLLLSLSRLVLYPRLSATILHGLIQTSYLGALPVFLDTIIVGITIFYPQCPSALHTAYVLFWISLYLIALVGFGGIFAMCHVQNAHALSEFTGVWLLPFILMIFVATIDSAIAQQFQNDGNAVVVLFLSSLNWSLGVGMCLMILTIYFWRLTAQLLPPRDKMISTFVPIGPLGMGAYAIVGLARVLATYITAAKFTLSWPKSSPRTDIGLSLVAVAEMIHWSGTLLALALIGWGTFFLVEAFASIASKFPRSFDITFWSFEFP